MNQQSHPGPRWVAVGKITRAHGVKGEVSVLPLSTVESRFQPGARLFLNESHDRSLMVSASRPHHRNLLVRFQDLSDRDTAEALRGEYLFVPVEDVPSLPEGEYWPFQIIGCQVRTEDGRVLGVLTEVIHTEANDVWVAGSGEGELLIPALWEVVLSVDVAGRGIVVRDVPGLTAT